MLNEDFNLENMRTIQNSCPLFIIGCPRSGTTWFSKILNSHSRVLMTNETAVFLWLDDAIKKSQKGIASGILYGKDYHQLFSDFLNNRYRKIIEDFYSEIATKTGKKDILYWGEKHPHFNMSLDRIFLHFPDAKYIYIVRDPRDCALSIANMNNSSIESSIKNTNAFFTAYGSFIDKVKKENVFIFRYEDAAQDTNKILGELCNWLDLNRDDEALNAYLEKFISIDAHTSGFTVKKRDFIKDTAERRAQYFSGDAYKEQLTILQPHIEKWSYE